MFGVNEGVVGGDDGLGEFKDGGLSENVCITLLKFKKDYSIILLEL